MPTTTMLLKFIIYLIYLREVAFQNTSQQDVITTKVYPKNWFAYVSQIMLSNLKRHYGNRKDVATNSQNDYFVSELFKFIHYSVGRFKFVLNMSTTSSKNSFIQNKTQSICIKAPCGKIGAKVKGFELEHKESTDCSLNPYIKKTQKVYTYFYAWSFHLDPLLRLRLLFYNIYISLKNLHSCYSGHVQVKSFTMETKWLPITYCGIHSYMVAYPPYNNVSVLISVKAYVTFIISLKYNIVDPKIKFSCTIQMKSKTITPEWVIYDNQKKTFMQKYTLNVAKWQKIQITIHILKRFIITIHDGLGIWSPILKSTKHLENKKYFSTSSFQCTIQTSFSSARKAQKALFFRAVSRKIERVLNFSGNKTHSHLSYPNGFCSTTLSDCILKVNTTENAKINVTITNLHHSGGLYEYGCYFFGLTAYSIIHELKDEISSVCSTSHGIYRHRSLYSKTNVMLLVVYTHREFGFWNMSLLVSTTLCNIVQIDICDSLRNFSSPNTGCTIHQLVHKLTIKSYETHSKRGCSYCPVDNLQYETFGNIDKEIAKVKVTGYMIGKSY